MERVSLPLGCAAAVASAALVVLACSDDSGSTLDRPPSQPIPTDGAAGTDAARREAGVPTKCATYAGSTSSDVCACGEAEPPFTAGPATDKCPAKDAPHYCISYDVTDPPPLRRECTCTPKCVFQKVSGGSSSGDAGGDVDTCRCGVSSHLVLGGEGSTDEARASCDGFAVCCRGSAGCDCTSNAGYVCPMNTTKVAACDPSDFNTKIYKAVAFGRPSYTDLVDVERCR